MWSDKETEFDCLGFSAYTTVLADICLQGSLAPLALGIFGSWGSGKTSLMHMLKQEVEARTLAGTETIWFNAWRYEGKEEAQSALVHSIIKCLEANRSITDEARQFIDKLKEGASVLKLSKFIFKTVTTMTPDIAGLLDCFKDESQKVADTMESFDKNFSKLMELVNVDRIIVFIDDLDRCSSAKVIETFETIKLFLNTPACTFVIGADPVKIERAVGDVYSFADALSKKDYLEKIIQVPFNIPQQSVQDIECYVGMLVLGQCLDETGWKTLRDSRSSFYSAGQEREAEFQKWRTQNEAFYGADSHEIERQLKVTVPFVSILASGLRGNPRQIKRFLNVLGLRRRLAMANNLVFDPELIIKVGVLEYVWPEFFLQVAETVDPSSGKSELLAEMHAASERGEAEIQDSALVSDAMRQSGLMRFLLESPKLDGQTDLTSYVFLAQTSLSRKQQQDLVPIDEQVQEFVTGIESEDRVRSSAYAKRASAAGPDVAEAVAKTCCDRFASIKDARTRTHVLIGLQTLCRTHIQNYGAVAKLVGQLGSPTQGEALIAGMLLDEAGKAGVVVPSEALARVQKATKFEALGKTPSKAEVTK